MDKADVVRAFQQTTAFIDSSGHCLFIAFAILDIASGRYDWVGRNLHSHTSSGAVGLYHVEGVTPDAKEKGRKLLAKGYKTYVIDDKEQARIISTFKNLWPNKDGDPTAAFIGCPHNTYHEVIKWGKLVTEALDKAGKKKAAIPVYMFMPNPVRDRAIEEHGDLISKMKRAGMVATNMCGVSYAGMKLVSGKWREKIAAAAVRFGRGTSITRSPRRPPARPATVPRTC